MINTIEDQYNINKELLLALMGIETNFGTYVGKMDILSSLSTLSFDKRRSEFFSNELIILLRLIEDNQIDYKTLYGSWAGAFGYFQFMPSTMKNYAIDHDKNSYIDLKDNNDAYASAANYLSKIGWKDNQPCFYKINLSNEVPKKYLNVSAKKLHNKKKLKYFRKYITNDDILITRERHRQHLQQCLDHLNNFNQKNEIEDFDKAAEDLRLATRHLGMIVGKVNVEEILGSIFNDFCIGK